MRRAGLSQSVPAIIPTLLPFAVEEKWHFSITLRADAVRHLEW